MPWSQSIRRADLPGNWNTLRKQVRQRAGDQCEAQRNGRRCPNQGTECHHTGDRTDHRIEKLQWICHDCHKRQTDTDRVAKYSTKRPVEQHPGVRGGGRPPTGKL